MAAPRRATTAGRGRCAAAAAAFRSERYLRVDGRQPPGAWHPVSGFYRAGDGRWIQLHCNFPHHRDGVLRVLGCDGTREAVTVAVTGWKAAELEDALAAAGLCAGMVRAPDEWQLHSQAQAVAELPLFEIVQIGEAPAVAPGSGDRPLSGVRVLDLTRVIAGPVCGRTLAEHGADVLLVTAEHLPSIEVHVMDFGHGKRSARLDLRRADHAERLRSLIRSCDVICQSYRPGALAAHGLSAEELARLRPGIVYVTLSAYSHVGPWRERRGFDSLVQSVSGIAHEGGAAAGLDGPRHLPAQALDHATGYLAAFGAMVALARRAREGGSYLVRVSLAQTGRWLDRLLPRRRPRRPRSPRGRRRGVSPDDGDALRRAQAREPGGDSLGDSRLLGASIGAARNSRARVVDLISG